MRFIRAAVLAAAVLIALLNAPGSGSALPTVHLATASDETATTWSVVPGDSTGVPDGRRWVELTLEPGEIATEQMVVTNHGTEPAEFKLTAADGYFTDTGRFNMLPSDRPSTDAGTWIEIQPSIQLQSGESRSVPFTVTVPANATPGDHPAGIAAGITSGANGQVGIESRVGFRVMTRVAGELAPELRTSTEVTYAQTWNPFSPGTLTVTYAVRNTGNTRLTASPVVAVSGPLGLLNETVSGEVVSELAPGESRTFSVTMSNWPLVVSTVDVRANAVVVAVDGAAPPVDPSTATATVVALPFGQAVVVLGFALLVVIWVRDRRARRRHVERLVAEAREEGRRTGQPRSTRSISIDGT